jgi:hypothetical protein
MAINPNQISVTKIYPGNYTNVLRYWHEPKSVDFLNENGTSETLTNQPVGGPVGVIFRPGWIAQQAVGYVDLSYQALGSVNQLEYYTTPYGSGLNGDNVPFTTANVIIPSPDYHKDIRSDIANGITVPSGAYVYRVGLRLDGGDVVSSGVGGGSATPTLGLGPALSVGLNTTPSPSGFFATVVGSNSRIENGSFNSSNAWNEANMHAVTADTTYKLSAVRNLGGVAASGLALGSGVYDPRAKTGKLIGKDKALAICEVCWLVPDEPPKRSDVALQPAGVVESSIYTSTTPSA